MYFDIISWSSSNTNYWSNNSKINVSDATVTGNNNKVTGDGNQITGNNLKVVGHKNTVTGNNSKVVGDFNTVTGNNTKVVGFGCIVNGNNTKHEPTPSPTYKASITEQLDDMLVDAKRDGEKLDTGYYVDGVRGSNPREAVERYKAQERQKDALERARINELIKSDTRKWKIDMKLDDEEYQQVEDYMEGIKHLWELW